MEQFTIPRFFIPNPQVYSHNYVQIKKALQFFSIDNCLIFIGSSELGVFDYLKVVKDFKRVRDYMTQKNEVPIPILDHIEPIHSTSFSIYHIPRILYKYWATKIPNKYFRIAPLNHFLYKASDLYFINERDGIPEKISDTSFVKTWIYPIIVMNNPLISVKCEFRSQNIKTTFLHSGMLRQRHNVCLYIFNVTSLNLCGYSRGYA